MAQPMVVIDTESLSKFAITARQFSPKLLTSLRKRLKVVGQVAVEAVKQKLAEPSPGGGPDEGVMRAALARGTSLTVSFSKNAGGVKIKTTSTGLPAEHKAVLAVYNQKSTRHPVFGDRSRWVEQPGNPYFGAAIKPVVDERLLAEMEATLEDAMRAIGAR